MKKCPYCAELIQDEAILCRYCGKEIPKVASNLNNQNAIPRFDPLQSTPPPAPAISQQPVKPKKKSILPYIFITIIIFLFICILMALTNTNAPTSSKPISNITWQEIKNNKDSMTEVQWKDYEDQIAGKRIQWTGFISDVADDISGTNYVWMCIDAYGCEYAIADRIYFEYPVDKSKNLQKGQMITVEGDIASSPMILLGEVELENANIIQ